MYRNIKTVKQIQNLVVYSCLAVISYAPNLLPSECSSLSTLVIAEIKQLSWWRHNWKSAQMVNSHLVCDPTIRQPGFYLPRQQWSLMNRFRTEQGHCGACRRKWRLTDTDLCPCGETKTMSHIVESWPWQNWMAAYPGCTLQMKMLFRRWPVMVHDTHTRRRRRRRRRRSNSLVHCLRKCTKFVYHNKHGWPQRREENILLSKPTTDRRKASRGLSVTAALLV